MDAGQGQNTTSVYAVPLWRQGEQVRFVFIPLKPQASIPAALAPGSTRTWSQWGADTKRSIRTSWKTWGQQEGTWARWVHDLGQRHILEDISADARLARGVPKDAEQVSQWGQWAAGNEAECTHAAQAPAVCANQHQQENLGLGTGLGKDVGVTAGTRMEGSAA